MTTSIGGLHPTSLFIIVVLQLAHSCWHLRCCVRNGLRCWIQKLLMYTQHCYVIISSQSLGKWCHVLQGARFYAMRVTGKRWQPHSQYCFRDIMKCIISQFTTRRISQHNFIKDRSTSMQLAHVAHDWVLYLNRKQTLNSSALIFPRNFTGLHTPAYRAEKEWTRYAVILRAYNLELK